MTRLYIVLLLLFLNLFLSGFQTDECTLEISWDFVLCKLGPCKNPVKSKNLELPFNSFFLFFLFFNHNHFCSLPHPEIPQAHGWEKE